MYYEEKIENGRLYVRHTPDGEWFLITFDALMVRFIETKQEADENRVEVYRLNELIARIKEFMNPISDLFNQGERSI